MAGNLAPSPEATQLDRIEAAQHRMEQKLDMLLLGLAEDPDADAPREDLDGGPAYGARADDEPL